MFGSDFYPTGPEVIQSMIEGIDLNNKVILEPSAGKGNIIDFIKSNFNIKDIIGCEIEPNLREIAKNKCNLIADDFLSVTSEQISHIDYIIMNPPFSADEKHILHAYNIAPGGCEIIALCNYNTVKNTYTKARQELVSIIDMFGRVDNLGAVFSDAERSTGVEVGLIRLKKPGENYTEEFSGFFMDEDIEEQENGIMPYNVIRDLVNRYVEAIKIFDDQLNTAVRMHTILHGFFNSSLSFNVTEDNKPKTRNEFKKDLQKSAWRFIFDKLNMQKYATRGLKEDINKFIEKQDHIPFTMRNIYKMLEIIIGTNGSRMDKAIIEVFDKLTQHYDENRFHVEGWKTNSHYLIGKKFILPHMFYQDQRWDKGSKISVGYGSSFDLVEDLLKALCYLTGDDYDSFKPLGRTIRDNNHEYGGWFDWSYFRVKAFKKGTAHFEFKTDDIWATLNQKISQIKGYPLPESVKKSKPEPKKSNIQNNTVNVGTVLFEMSIK